MTTYTFKTYIANGREYFEYGEKEYSEGYLIKKDFPFPESLMGIFDLDIWKYEPLTKKIDRALMELYRTKDEGLVQEILAALDELAQTHIYFEFLRLDWKRRFEEAQRGQYKNARDLLPRKSISHIPSDIDMIQRQLTALFTDVLDADLEKEPIPKRMVLYYRECGADTLNTFQFRPLPLSYELTEQGIFTDVLYPKTVADLIDFSLRECVKRGVKMRICKNCGRYFPTSGRGAPEYCTRVTGLKGGTCREIGAAAVYAKNKQDDRIFREYRREYKKRFSWIKAGRVTAEQFYEWSRRASEKKADCDEGLITLEEFSLWLRSS